MNPNWRRNSVIALAGTLALALAAAWASGLAKKKDAPGHAAHAHGQASAGPVAAAGAACAPDPACAGATSCAAPSAGTACAAPSSGTACAAPSEKGACSAAAACAPDVGAGTGGASAAKTAIRIDPARGKRATSARGQAALAGRSWEDLGPRLEAIRARYRVPGLAAALVRDGEIVAAGVAGVRRAGGADPIEPDDRFHIGSCGKSFTATVAARLVAKGVIGWETTLADVFPELKRAMEPAYRSVTLRQLVAHRSGLPSLERGGSPMWLAISSPGMEVSEQRETMLRLAVKEDPVAMPGAAFAYTDLGYAVAGRMLERASGKSWEDLIRSEIAGPLGLATLGFGAPGTKGSLDQPWGHTFKEGSVRAIAPGPGADQAGPVIGPAGTIHLSIADWARYARSHLAAARAAAGPGGAALAALYEDPYRQGYGMGWAISDAAWAGGRLLSHTGSCGAWAAATWIAPERNAALVVASNYGGPEGFAAGNAAAAELIEAYLKR